MAHPRRATAAATALLLILAASPAIAQLKELETKDLRLVYFDPTLTYLTPHVARCFENALAFHRKLFDYTPSGKVTVLLDDFADYGNAAATGVPRDVREGGHGAALVRLRDASWRTSA